MATGGMKAKPRLHRDHRLEKLTRVFTDEGIQKPFLAIFVWTVVFSLITVFLTVAVGMVSGVSGAVGSVARQSGLSRPAYSALRGAIVHFNLDFQRVV
ncbi:maltose transporter membrane protein [Escherichia coli]|uniref:Maltose/maltodextrin transport system permease protein n=1 Tax=Escherichia coli TaxID=562 RepID=A0A377KEE9_ECOLX|nr:maltose transporter membrane protein [Escherichia coli]